MRRWGRLVIQRVDSTFHASRRSLIDARFEGNRWSLGELIVKKSFQMTSSHHTCRFEIGYSTVIRFFDTDFPVFATVI